MNFSHFSTTVLNGTPVWVWVVLSYLIFVGIKAFRPRVVYAPRLIIVPLLFMTFKISMFMSGNITYIIAYLSAFCIGLALGAKAICKNPPKIIKETKSVEMKGTYKMLAFMLFLFTMRFTFSYMSAIDPDFGPQYQVYELIIAGGITGYFLGRAFSVIALCFKG